MRGRVRLSSDYSEIKIKLKFAPNAPAPNYAPDWNKPPTEAMLVAIRSADGERIPKMMRCGLLPCWAKNEELSYSRFNARLEEFRTKPMFNDAWMRGQRCVSLLPTVSTSMSVVRLFETDGGLICGSERLIWL